MLKSCTFWASVLVGAATLSAPSKASADQPSRPAPVVTSGTQVSCEPAKCDPNFPTKITPELAQLSPDFCALPVQDNLDFYAWREFIALNWPANVETCSAELGKTILDSTGSRVWETWLSDVDVIVPKGSTPKAWCATSSQLSRGPAPVRVLGRSQSMRLQNLGKAHGAQTFSANATVQAVGGVLVDQNGRFVRYETRLNEDEYNYLIANNLWNKAGQQGARISMPSGPGDKVCNGQCCGPMGAIEVKASWKVLGKNDDPKRFYTIQAVLVDESLGPKGPVSTTMPATLGLVGLHIAHKTASQQKWIWATFEQVDNVTKSFNNRDCKQTPTYNPDEPVPCPGECCPPNSQTAAKDPTTGTYVELGPDGKPLNRPTQVVRVHPIANKLLNGQFQALLKGSVWENYELVSTQWVDTDKKTTPAFLANTTLETFNQGPTPPTNGKQPYQPFSTKVSSSCMKCHDTAKSAAGGFADFSFILGDAQ